jgi:hypothetical protein
VWGGRLLELRVGSIVQRGQSLGCLELLLAGADLEVDTPAR